MSFTPTIVVGLGRAGCRMAAAVDERLADADVADSVEILGIDSRAPAVERALPADASSLTLGPPSNYEQADRPYLEDGYELPPEGGAVRQRPVGRAFVDNPNGLDRVWQFLETHVEEFLTGVETNLGGFGATELNVWVVNSLAGGTGSGAFPLVAGLLDELLSGVKAERGIETTLRGVGSVPRLDRVAEQVRQPAQPPSHYLNAYAGLADVQTLLGDESAPVSLHPDATDYVKDRIDVGGALDRYLLVGIREAERDYLASVNRAVADAVYYFGTAAVTANFPNHPAADDARILSLDGGRLTFPAEAAEDYLSLRDEIAATRDELDRVERNREAIAADYHYLDAVLSLDRDSLPPSDSPVSRQLVRRCEAAAGSLERSPGELDARVDGVVTELVADFEPGADRAFDSSTVIRYFVLRLMATTAAQERTTAREELSEFMRGLVDTYGDALRAHTDGVIAETIESSPQSAADEIEQCLATERDRLVEERDASLPLVGDLFSDLDARIQHVTRSLDELAARRAAYERYLTALDGLEEAFYTSRETLSTRRRELEDERYELDDRAVQTERELERLRAEFERVTAELSDPAGGRHQTTVAVDPERLDSEVLEWARESGFAALVEAELLDRETVEQAIRAGCARRQEPIQDSRLARAPFGALAPVCADVNADQWLDGIEAAAKEAGFDVVADHADTTEALSVSLLGLYGVDLDATSEFGTLEEYLTDDQRDLSELFGPAVASVPSPIAYPELQ